MPTKTKVSHRLGPDGTWDSICLHCFRTIAQTNREKELAKFEREHVCYPISKAYIKLAN